MKLLLRYFSQLSRQPYFICLGALVLIVKEKNLNKIMIILVAFSAGALIGAALLHLLPEKPGISQRTIGLLPLTWVIVGFVFFHHGKILILEALP